MGVSMIPVNAWMHLESFEVFILSLALFFFSSFCFSEALLSCFFLGRVSVSFLSVLLILIIPPNVFKSFFSVCLLLSYGITCT